MKELRFILINKYIVFCFILILMQQITSASSTVWLAYLSEAIVTGGHIWLFLALVLICSCIIFIPAIFTMMLLQEAKFTIKNKYIGKFIENYKGFATLARDQELRDEKEPWPAAESDVIIQDFLYYFFNSFTSLFMIGFYIIAIIYVTEPIMLLGYFISLCILSVFLYISKHKISKISNSFQDASIEVRKYSLQTWDNVLIGNDYNLNSWTTKYQVALNNLKKRAVIMMGATEFFMAFPVMLAFLPVGGIIIWLFYTHSSDVVYLAALTTTLPRQIQIIQSMHGLAGIVTGWHSIKIRLLRLQESMHLVKTTKMDPEQRINWELLDINSCTKIKINSLIEFMNYLAMEPIGRITLRGPNGSGKSTLLAILKEKYAADSIYIPASHDLSFAENGMQCLSSGQKVLKELNELITKQKSKFLLLDEWDANLDNNNIVSITEILDKLAQSTCLIEARHR